MERRNGDGIGMRQADLKQSFKLAIRPMLTACSKQDTCKAFPSFTIAEQDYLHSLFIKVLTSLHENIEDAFESICLEYQVGSALDTVEQLVEEQTLDPLLSNKINVVDVAQDVLTTKKNEAQHLKNMLEMAEEQNRLIRARVDALKKRESDASGLSEAVEKFRRGSSNYALVSRDMNNNP